MTRRKLVERLADRAPVLGPLRRERIELHESLQALSGELLRLRHILQVLYDDEPGNRRRLYDLRASDDYELAFTEQEPLVSVLIPTYMNHEGLAEIAVPSILGQTHRNLELIVVGDAAPAETEEALSRFDDPRLVYRNRERRGPYPADARGFTFAKAGPPMNEARRLARGRWLVMFADDDAMRPHQIERLLAVARQERCEVCYGRALMEGPKGPVLFGKWPPDRGHVAFQSAIVHAGLRFIEHELADALFEVSGDKSLLRRMVRAGVRFGFVDEVLTDYPYREGRGLEKAARYPRRKLKIV